MMIPLFNEAQCYKQTVNEGNIGLYYEKFYDGWVNGVAAQGENKEPAAKKKFLCDVTDIYYKENCSKSRLDLLESYRSRRHRMARVLKGRILQSSTLWRFVSGLGATHPSETGFIWHRTLGVPYLPGSSLKGAVRAWLTYWDSDEESEKRVRELFGDTESGQGKLIFFDVLPVECPKLELDIMNPHYAPYYSSNNPDENPPGDYYSPNPIHFLTVAPGQKFEFIVAPTPNSELGETDIDQVVELLKSALSTIGCGAKTAVGYGLFDKFDNQTESIFREIEAEEEKRELEGLTPFEQECHRLRKRLKNIDNRLKDDSITFYRTLVNLDEKEKVIAAQTLKEIWQALGAWDGRLSDKQRNKVDMVKSILKEN